MKFQCACKILLSMEPLGHTWFTTCANMLHERVPGTTVGLLTSGKAVTVSGDRVVLAGTKARHWRLGFGKGLFRHPKVVLHTVD